jgi:hypothetical protein
LEEILDEVGFPIFVADLIESTFDALVDVSIQQMETIASLYDIELALLKLRLLVKQLEIRP